MSNSGWTDVPTPGSNDGWSDVAQPAPAPTASGVWKDVTDQASHFTRAIRSGKTPGKAAATVPALKALAKGEADWRQRLDIIRKHPVEALFDYLSSGQRAVGSVAGSIEQHRSLGDSLKNLAHDVLMTPDATQNEHIRAATTESIRKAFDQLHIAPSHSVIDAWVNQHVPKEMRPYAAAFLKGGEDTALQTVSDPTTLFGGWIMKGGLRLLQGAHNVAVMRAAAQANGAGKMVPFFDDMLKRYANASHAMGNFLTDAWKPRRDLDTLFTSGPKTAEGRKVRLSIENSEYHFHGERAALDREAAKGGSLDDRLHNYINNFGTRKQQADLHRLVPGTRANAPTPQGIISRKGGVGDVAVSVPLFHTSSDAAKTEFLAKLNKDIRDGLIARRTEKAVAQTPGLLKPGAGVTNWRSVKSFDDTTKLSKIAYQAKGLPVIKQMRDLMRVSIFLNPLPHGFKNVGQLAFMAGGFPAVFRGMKAMVPGGRNPGVLKELAENGALPSYTQHTIEQSFWAKAIPGWAKVAGGMQDAMTHMEHGWRVGLWETLEKKMGPATTQHDKLIRAAMVNEFVGDYRNQSAMVHMFEAVGGPFVAFRLGIVPQNVVRAIANNPERILAALRVPENLQRNRESAKGGGPLSVGKNELEMGGPISDFARMLPGGGIFGEDQPLRFALSPSTIGPLGEVDRWLHSDRSAFDKGLDLASRYIPGGELVQMGATAAGLNPGAMEGQKMSLADRLIASTLQSMAVYFYRLQNTKQQRAEVGRIRKQGL